MANIADNTMDFAQNLHTVLQKALVAVPSGSVPNSVAALMLPGQSIDERDFYYLPDDENPDYDAKPENMSTLVNHAVKLDPTYNTTQNNISLIYGNIVKNAQLPPSKDWSADERKRFDNAGNYLSRHVAEYIKWKLEYDKANESYWFEKKSSSRNSREKEFKRNMDSAMLNWEAAGKIEYERNQDIQRELLISSPAAYFRAVAELYDRYKDEGYPSTFLPSSWALAGDDLSWTAFSFKAEEGSKSTSVTQEEKTILREEIYKKTGFFESIARWFRPSPTVRVDTTEIKSMTDRVNTRMEFKSITVKCELARVNVYREWMDLGVLQYAQAKVAGLAAGAISTGRLSSANDGSMPGYISALILARNIELGMNLDQDGADALKQLIDQQGTPKKTFCSGSFEVNETCKVRIHRNENSSYSNKYEVTITCPGKQLIGSVNTLVPRFPQ